MTDLPVPKRNKLFVPTYSRVADDLRARIREGLLAPGEMLPGMKRLAKDYGVAVGTIHQAIATLIEDGTLVSDGWRGTFVATRRDESEADAVREPQVHTTLEGSALISGRKTVGILASFPPNIANITKDASDFWQIAIVNGIEHELSLKPGIAIRFVNLMRPDLSQQSPEPAVTSLMEGGVDGVIVIRHANVFDEAEVASALGEIPLVIATADSAPRAIPFAGHDNFSAGFDAVTHLLGAGWRRVTFMAPFADTCLWQEERIQGAIEAVRRFRIAPENLTVYRNRAPYNLMEDHTEHGYTMGNRLMREVQIEGRGIVAINDNFAYGVRSALLEHGLSPGIDYALIGFDNRYPSLEQGITSLAPPFHAIGEQAARLLLKEMRGVRTLTQIWLRSRLIPRASTRPPITVESGQPSPKDATAFVAE